VAGGGVVQWVLPTDRDREEWDNFSENVGRSNVLGEMKGIMQPKDTNIQTTFQIIYISEG
jgi:hypothetical protein